MIPSATPPTVFITGTDHGLGAALATRLADQGARVFAGVLSPPLQTEQTWPGGGSLHRVPLDIGSDESVAGAAAFVSQRCDHLDWVINNGAILGDIVHTAFETLDFDHMLRVYNVNTLGSLRVSHALLPLLLRGSDKLICNISSEAGSIGACQRRSWYAYAQSKAALNMQSALLHNLLRDEGGRVVVLHPGHVRTYMNGTEDLKGELGSDEAADLVLANIQRGRLWQGALPPFFDPRGELLPW